MCILQVAANGLDLKYLALAVWTSGIVSAWKQIGREIESGQGTGWLLLRAKNKYILYFVVFVFTQ
jgi:hypothetical protein